MRRKKRTKRRRCSRGINRETRVVFDQFERAGVSSGITTDSPTTNLAPIGLYVCGRASASYGDDGIHRARCSYRGTGR